MSYMFLLGSSCIFPVQDLQKTRNFYCENLGFQAVEYLDCLEPHICLYKDQTEIILLQAGGPVIPNRLLYGYGYDGYFYTRQLAKLQEHLEGRQVRIVKGQNVTDYDNLELVIEDCDGRWIAFGAKSDPDFSHPI